jgi:alanine dehydrogenase
MKLNSRKEKGGLLYLTERNVSDLLTMHETLSIVKSGFEIHGFGMLDMPPKIYLDFPKGDLRIMPAYPKNTGIAGVKIVNVHPGNPEIGLPTVGATITLNSIDTGELLAIMGGKHITDIRTGAAGGVAADYLSRRDSHTVGIVGAGQQARTQLEAISLVRNIDNVKIYDLSYKACSDFRYDMKDHDVTICDAIEDVCRCDILVTATPSRTPIIKDEWIDYGTHINAMGADAPGKQELDPMLFRCAKIVVDDWIQASHSGEINVLISQGLISKDDIHAELGTIIARHIPVRTEYDDVTVFDSTGLAIHDIAVANFVYEKAIKEHVGTYLTM